MAIKIFVFALSVFITVLKVSEGKIPVCEEGPCRAGFYFDPGKDLCLPCEEGSFVSQDFHRCHDCKPCTEVDLDLYSHEVVLVKCTTKHDTKIGCDPGYHRVETGFGHPGYCEVDSGIPGEVKVDDATRNQDDVVCEEGPCRAGHYLDPGSDRCLPCNAGSFVSQDFHRCQDCKPCTKVDLDPYSRQVVLANCTAKQDTKIGCEPGYRSTKMSRTLLLSLLLMLVVAAVVVEAGPRGRGHGRGGWRLRRPGRRHLPPPPPLPMMRPRLPVLAKFAKVVEMLMTSCNDGTTKQGDFLTICNAVHELVKSRPHPLPVPDHHGVVQGQGQNTEDAQEYEGQGQPDIPDDAAAEVDLSDKDKDTALSD